MIERSGPMPIGHKVVAHNGLVYVCGMISPNLAPDMKTQARGACKRIEELLGEQGVSKDNLISAMIHVTDLNLRPDLNEVWKEWLSAENMPVRTCVGVSDLGEGVMIEITAVAAR